MAAISSWGRWINGLFFCFVMVNFVITTFSFSLTQVFPPLRVSWCEPSCFPSPWASSSTRTPSSSSACSVSLLSLAWHTALSSLWVMRWVKMEFSWWLGTEHATDLLINMTAVIHTITPWRIQKHFIVLEWKHWNLTYWALGDTDSILRMQISVLFTGRYRFDFKNANFSLFYWFVSSDFLIMMLSDEWQDLTVNKSILVQVIAWCRQATSHYLS